jgi:Zn-dependent M28 family amino/carboxypeptidase
VPAVNLRQSDLVFVGYGISAPEYHWNDYAGVDVHGKTVIVLVGDPGYGSKDPAVFRGSASYYGQWAYKVEEATRQGAVGVLLVHDAGPLGYNWSVVASTWGGAQLELAKPDDNAGHAAVEGWLSGAAAIAVFAQAGLDYDALARASSRPGFKALAMGLKVETTINNSIRRFTSSNVIALLPGGQRKHEYVVYSAHWDGLGRDPNGAVYSGAVGNASGVAGLLMLAQSFSRTRPPPDRSIVFIAFTAEEPGLLGSRYYVENPVFSLGETAGALNLDGLRVGGRTRDVMILGAGNSELEDYVRGIALLQGREMRPEPHPEQGLFYGSDQLNFALHGVPALDVKGGVDDAARGPQWGLAQMDDYMARRYRQTGDKYSEDWNVAGAVEDLELYRAVGERLASTRRFPRWYPSSEFSSSRSREALAE